MNHFLLDLATLLLDEADHNDEYDLKKTIIMNANVTQHNNNLDWIVKQSNSLHVTHSLLNGRLRLHNHKRQRNSNKARISTSGLTAVIGFKNIRYYFTRFCRAEPVSHTLPWP